MTRVEVRTRLNELNSGEYNFNEFYDFIDSLMKSGPTAEEVLGFNEAIKDKATLLHPNMSHDKTTEVSGTGGDTIKTVNVGTMTSLVLAAAGLTVTKHTQRAFTGHTGSQELFDHLGISVDLEKSDPKKAEKMLENVGFAAFYHSAFNKNFANTRHFVKDLKKRKIRMITPWHIASWLVCVVPTRYRMYGMFTDKYFDIAAEVLKEQGVEKGWVLHGVDGLDEVSNVGDTKVLEFSRSGDKRFSLKPEDFGIKKAKKEDILISSVKESFEVADKIIAGKGSGPHNDLVLINSAAGLYIASLVNSLQDGVKMADELLKSGKVKKKIKEIRENI